jgi:hypothetical protein
MSVAKKDNYEVLFLDFDEVKWYDSFPEVIAWKAFLAKAEESGMYYEFVRLGEDDSDVELDSNVDDDGSYILVLERHIKINVSVNFEREDYVRNTI